jgi:hypothetical protein
MDEQKKVAVIIPFYKNNLSAYEAIALQQCFKILSGHTVIAIKPQQKELPGGANAYPFFKTVSFADDYFSSVQGYNRLMLDASFYQAFLDYDYILIYQLDAFVFKDELDYWCSQGFDYIGAPWIRGVKQGVFKMIKNRIQNYIHIRYNILKEGLPSPKQFIFKTGNGGFSLRRTQPFYDMCLQYRDKIAIYNSRDSHYFNEDVFWSIEINRRKKVLRIPYYKTALKFSFEFYPVQAMVINHQELPFGCHAWDLYADFWRPIFKQAGYDI